MLKSRKQQIEWWAKKVMEQAAEYAELSKGEAVSRELRKVERICREIAAHFNAENRLGGGGT